MAIYTYLLICWLTQKSDQPVSWQHCIQTGSCWSSNWASGWGIKVSYVTLNWFTETRLIRKISSEWQLSVWKCLDDVRGDRVNRKATSNCAHLHTLVVTTRELWSIWTTGDHTRWHSSAKNRTLRLQFALGSPKLHNKLENVAWSY